jgi:phage tail sheath protein FI
MASTYKTPGVYVEEIVKLPPSVAEVETAIPAFVGYTEIAKRYVDDDLINIPTRLTSLLEYEQYFGKGPSYSNIHVQLTSANAVDTENTTVSNSIYNLYQSMQLFFDNGGGNCYVSSAGKYSASDDVATRSANIKAALGEVRKYDEPTILLFPDAVSLNDGTASSLNSIADIQQSALKQCGDLGDRFAVLDVPELDGKTVLEQADSFRSKIGMNNLKYGAAYMPYLTTTYAKDFPLRDIAKNFYNSANAQIELKSLFTDADKDSNGVLIKTKLDNFKQIYTDNDAISARLSLFTGKSVTTAFDSNNLDSMYQATASAYKGAANDAARLAALKSAFEFIFNAFVQLEGLVTAHVAETDTTNNVVPAAGKPIRTAVVSNAALNLSIAGFLPSNLGASLQTFRNLDNEAYRIGVPDISGTAGDLPAANFALFTASTWSLAAAADAGLISGATLTDKGNAVFDQLNTLFQTLKSGYNSVVNIGTATEEATQKALTPDLPIYNSILQVLNGKVNTLPPSGAVAGVYATVDSNRGVWKAPANVSINSVGDVGELIDDNTQENLNVDSNAGKSINAIRAFFGKGILVWGARTLAGNDNEWRYVPVRRLFSYAEESCKKSTSWCVFEPNDANTWARIRAQIDNFMNNLWRRGALAGAKPEQAYYVNCGIGITMTAQDILEGYLVVEIGMAAVRPAEFVVLRFSHLLQQS